MSASSKKKLRKEQAAAQLTEKQLTEQKEAKKLKINTAIFAVIILLVVAVGLASLAVTTFKTSGIAERTSKALTVGEHTLTAAELNYFFIDNVNEAYQNWRNSYGDYINYYLLMMGLDLTQPLDKQIYNQEEGTTYADYFAEQAVADAVNTYAIYDAALASGMTVTEEDTATVETSLMTMEYYAALGGYTDLKSYIRSVYGAGASEKTLRSYLEMLSVCQRFQEEYYNTLTYTQADLDAYNEEHFDEFSSFTYSTFFINQNEFLVCTAAEDDKDHKHTVDELSTAQKNSEAAAKTLMEAKPTNAEEFNAAIQSIATFASRSCTENKAVLYPSLRDGDEVKEWLNEAGRKAGDMTIITETSTSTDENGNTVEKPYGYTLVLFHERIDNDMELVNVRHLLKQPTGGTTDANGNTTYTDEQWKAAEDALAALQAEWEAAGKTEDALKALIKEKTDDTASKTTEGLYENVYPGQMTPAFSDWCFDEARQEGDYGVVKTDYGYHLIYFCGRTGVTFRNYMVENTLRNDEFNAWIEGINEAAKYTVHNTAKLSLDMILSK